MPPDEPVTESLEELLSQISYKTEHNKESQIRMSNEDGDWWLFGFKQINTDWTLQSASAKSDKIFSPHNLLDSVYGSYFRPFLEHTTNKANKAANKSQ